MFSGICYAFSYIFQTNLDGYKPKTQEMLDMRKILWWHGCATNECPPLSLFWEILRFWNPNSLHSLCWLAPPFYIFLTCSHKKKEREKKIRTSDFYFIRRNF